MPIMRLRKSTTFIYICLFEILASSCFPARRYLIDKEQLILPTSFIHPYVDIRDISDDENSPVQVKTYKRDVSLEKQAADSINQIIKEHFIESGETKFIPYNHVLNGHIYESIFKEIDRIAPLQLGIDFLVPGIKVYKPSEYDFDEALEQIAEERIYFLYVFSLVHKEADFFHTFSSLGGGDEAYKKVPFTRGYFGIWNTRNQKVEYYYHFSLPGTGLYKYPYVNDIYTELKKGYPNIK